MNKACPKCGKEYTLSGFSKNRTKADGLQSVCKECVRKANLANSRNNVNRVRAWRAANPDRTKMYQREYYKKNQKHIYSRHCDWRNRNPSLVSTQTNEYRTKHPGKWSAVIELNNAVRDGIIYKPTKCQLCGIGDVRIHGHHEDYNKPLDVLWVCPKCHASIHQEKRNGRRTNQSTISTESAAANHYRAKARNGNATL